MRRQLGSSATRAAGAALLLVAMMSCTVDRCPGGGSMPGTQSAAGTTAAAPLSGTNTTEQLQARAEGALRGKTIAWVPVLLGVPLMERWTQVMREEAEARGMKFEVRDPNTNTTAGLQAVSALIAERPAVMVIHNPNVQLYASELQRAEAAGIQVIQVNMVSNYKTAAYVGPDWQEVGRMIAEETIKDCGTGSGTSGKVQIVQGELTSDVSIQQLEGMMSVFDQDPAIKVVSSQGADWDASKAYNITTTVIQQHPDLCASVGFWGVMQSGAAQAIKAAGKIGQVKIYASGGDGKLDCENVDSGLFTKQLSYDGTAQARTIIDLASFLLQAGQPPNAFRTAHYSPLRWMERGRYDTGLCYDWVGK